MWLQFAFNLAFALVWFILAGYFLVIAPHGAIAGIDTRMAGWGAAILCLWNVVRIILLIPKLHARESTNGR